MSEPTRNHDLGGLRQRIRVPAPFTRAVWLVRPLGESTIDFGSPTDAQMLAWLPVADAQWDEVRDVVGTAGRVASRTLQRKTAALLLPPSVLAELATNGDRVEIVGDEYSTVGFETVFWKPGWAIALADGLLVCLING